MKEKEKDLIEYLVLLIGLVVVFCLFVVFRFNKEILKFIGLFGVLYYITWGTIHHTIRNRLSVSVLVEYIFIGLLIYLLFYNVLTL